MPNSLVTPWTVARHAPLPMGFSRQEYWSVLPFLSSGDLIDPGIKPTSPALAGGFFSTEQPGKPIILLEGVRNPFRGQREFMTLPHLVKDHVVIKINAICAMDMFKVI